MFKPYFIVIEGIDGSGKSTQIELLQQRFIMEGLLAQTTHEPTDGEMGRLIREILSGNKSYHPSVTAALYLADRLDHITNSSNGVRKLLDQGINVISSRYYFSSYAFQSEYVPMEWLVNANNLCKSYLKADLTIYINIDPKVTIERLKQTRPSLDIYENLEKQEDVHSKFMEAFSAYGFDENIILIDGTLSVEEIHESIWSEIAKLSKIC